ncbi:MAG: VCBS repeat-containing protein [Acidobacteria bacterium]|nr:VCBS repeat-containing protein [Acidobacteriota bacterium]
MRDRKINRIGILSTLLLFAVITAAIAFVTYRSTPASAQSSDLAPAVVVFSENFDGVSAPNLPAGWTTTASGASLPFATVDTIPDSAPNSVFTNDPFQGGDASLTSPSISLGNIRHKLIFRQRYQLDYEFDGGVLELSIGGGAFTDIISAGGTFVTGGYDTPLVGGSLSGRQAWTGDSVTYVTTEINLPVSTSNQSIRLRWRFGSDPMEGGNGWRIDNVQITNAISGINSNSIAIPVSGPASVYPSEINVSNQPGLVTGVQVNLTNFSHASPDDVDLILVGPNGNKVVLMSDVGGANAVTNLNLVFDDTAAASLPDSTILSSGTFKPTDLEPGDTFPAPAPAGAPIGRMLSAFNGISPNGNWQLYLVDDNGSNAGSISSGWSISVQSSPDAIGLQATGMADPYPSQKLVAGVLGTVTKVVVSLSNLSHTAPDDVDVMLVAPNGRHIILMSDAGGTNEAGGLNLTFDDAAASSLPDSTTLSSGTFKPSNYEAGDTFPAPAPQGTPTGPTLGAFYGSAPNGLWKLYAVDDAGNNVGSIAGGWNLTLTASTTACDFTLSPTAQSFPTTGGSGSFGISMPSACSWTATSASGFLTVNSSAGGNGDATVQFSVAPNFGGPRSGSITVSNGVITKTFQVQQPSGCPTSVSQSTVNFGPAGGSGAIAVTAGGVCTYLATSGAAWTVVSSPSQTGNGTVTFNVLPNTSSNSRSTSVFVSGQTVTINQAGASGRRFDFDGDGKADLSVYRPASGVWWVLNSGVAASYFAVPFGISSDTIAPADFDGDRKTDLSIYRGGVWYLLQSQTNTVRIDYWGLAGDDPIPGDTDGDGKADLVVYRAAELNWYIQRSSDASVQVIQFGLTTTDSPLSGDFDGDGRMDLATTLAIGPDRRICVRFSGNGSSNACPYFGLPEDVVVPSDFDGDGRDNIAVFRPSTGTWYTSTNPATNYGAIRFGASGDVPAAADYDGDGKADVAVFRGGVWYILNSATGTVRVDFWGISGDVVIPAAYTSQ